MKDAVTVSLAFAIVFSSLSSSAHADAVSDQQKAYKAMGIDINTHTPPLCNLITKSEAAKFLGKPVRDGESAGVAHGCAYRAADNTNDGILVTRESRKDWSLPLNAKYRKLSGIGEQAYVYYEEPLGYEADGLSQKGTTGVLVSGKYSSATAISLLKLAIGR